MNKQYQWNIWYFVGAFFLLMLFQSMWTTYRTVHEQHCRQVCETHCRTVVEPRQRVCKSYTQVPVWTTRCYKVCTGD